MTPYMGWNTYYGIGGTFDEQTIVSVAQELLDRGLASAGYRIVWLDYGWPSGARGANGELIVAEDQWPHGLRWLTDLLHAMGLLAGIYTDAGTSGSDGQGVGSLGHYQQDADRFAACGFDAVKIDFCGGGQQHLDPRSVYSEFVGAIRANSSSRPMVVNACNFWRPGQVGDGYPPLERSAYATHEWASQIAESWRTDTDYIVPELGISPVKAQTQLTMWAVVAAPLVIGADVRALSSETVAMLSNPDVIAVDQDPLGIQGIPSSRDSDRDIEMCVKPLFGGAKAVALLNRGTQQQAIEIDTTDVGLPATSALQVRDLWTGTTSTEAGAIAAEVPAHGALLYRVTPAAPT